MYRSIVSRSGTAALMYGIATYGLFIGVFVYAIGFIGGILASTRLDGTPGRPFWQALAIDLGLLCLFAIQRLTARPAFVRRWTRADA